MESFSVFTNTQLGLVFGGAPDGSPELPTGANPQHEVTAHVEGYLLPARPFTVSKPDPTDWTRELWRAAYRQARSMIRDGGRHGIGARYVHCLNHMRRRFGASGWRIAQAAGHAVFDRRTVAYAASGSVADLERQGLVRRTRRPRPGNLTATVAYRCAIFERLRDHGFSLAWTHDPLASGSNRGLRVHRARKLRAERRLVWPRYGPNAVAWAMAEDRFALTLTGLFALQNAGKS